MKLTIKVSVILTQADSGGDVLVAVCSSKEKALELISQVHDLRKTEFYIEDLNLNVPTSSYKHFWEKQ